MSLAMQGYEVLRSLEDDGPLAAELDACMRDATAGRREPMTAGVTGNEFRYVPTMCERTPHSLGLLRRLAVIASDRLDAPVLPGRAKAVVYRGSTKLHRDSDLALPSIGIAFYLEPLTAATGALLVVPGSHLRESAAIEEAIALPTVPGDAIMFDERLFHASHGGLLRRQWRVDFVADRPATDDLLRAWFARQFSVGWDGGYDVARYPSYGAHFRALDARWNARLEALGAFAAAEAEESAALARRRD
jgi:hypothetical protein